MTGRGGKGNGENVKRARETTYLFAAASASSISPHSSNIPLIYPHTPGCARVSWIKTMTGEEKRQREATRVDKGDRESEREKTRNGAGG